MEGATDDDTLGATLDPEGGEEELASYLIPRLAMYAPSASPLSSSVASQVGEANGAAEEDYVVSLSRQRGESGSRAWDSGEQTVAYTLEDDTAGVTLRSSHGLPVALSASADEEAQEDTTTDAAPFIANVEVEDVADWKEEDEHDVSEVDEDDDEEIGNTDDSPQTRVAKHHVGASDVPNYVNAFAHNRVKELLKLEGSSSIISKDAVSAASEAVALLTRDLVTMAAGEATRRHRKTVAYEDIARVVQLLDRFSFLAEVVPPVAASSSNALRAGRSIMLGNNVHSAEAPSSSSTTKRHGAPPVRSRSAHGLPGRSALQSHGESPTAATRAKTAHMRTLGAAAYPKSGAGLRQATLRF